MAAALIGLAAVALAVGIAARVWAARSPGQAASPAPPSASRGPDQARQQAGDLLEQARAQAEEDRAESAEDLSLRQGYLDSLEPQLAELDRELSERRQRFDARRHELRDQRQALEEERAALVLQAQQARVDLAERAGLDRSQAREAVLERFQRELDAEHPGRSEATARALAGEPAETASRLLVAAIQRQDASHADAAPRLTPVALEELEEEARERLLTSLSEVAAGTSTELAIDAERAQASLRGIDPLGREVARQAALEVVDRGLQAAEVGPLLLRTRTGLARRVTTLGERALWEMEMGGRPELAELVGTLHYRFSYGQNALLHCRETGHICGLLAAELGLRQEVAREAGMLHDIGKAVDHDVEGSHAIIGGELLRLFDVDPAIVHAVKAHHFDEEPATDLAMLTICADAVSASRPGARRDTLASYLARLEQLQGIATRHAGVERAFPLQAGREVRVVVSAKEISDPQVQELSSEIAREIETEMQFPGMIKVVVVREMTATATAPAQVPVLAAAPTGMTAADADAEPLDVEPDRASTPEAGTAEPPEGGGTDSG